MARDYRIAPCYCSQLNSCLRTFQAGYSLILSPFKKSHPPLQPLKLGFRNKGARLVLNNCYYFHSYHRNKHLGHSPI